MFEKFGEMDSYTEINELAENLCNEEDFTSLEEMAKENGIPGEYVEMYQTCLSQPIKTENGWNIGSRPDY